MRKILIFAGTTEGRELSETLSRHSVFHTLCVTSKYGEEVLPENEYLTVHTEKMDAERMRSFINENGFTCVIDATHPYAKEASKNIREAVSGTDAEWFRLKRETGVCDSYGKLRLFLTHEECAKELQLSEGNILLTIGSRELSKYCTHDGLKDRLFVRIIPDEESLSLCTKLGIKGKNIIAMQGPFSEEMNTAMIDMYAIKHIVSKMSGTAGGFEAKLNAAKKKDIPFYAVGTAEEEEGVGIDGILRAVGINPEENNAEKSNAENCNSENSTGKIITATSERSVILAGVGMGNVGNVTKEVLEAVKEADLLIGASRLLEIFSENNVKKVSMYLAKDIIPYLNEHPEYRNIVILFSGDSGFYSGAKKLYEAFNTTTDVVIKILPGISSIAYLASVLKTGYEDARIYSVHGKRIYNIVNKIRFNRKIFLLLSGSEDVKKIGELLTGAGMNDVRITIAGDLSYDEESVKTFSPKECISYEGGSSLLTLYIENKNAEKKILTPGLANEAFIRDIVPMTKEEVREISLCKLHLTEDSILYDIGSGTGSVTVEAAGLSDSVFVYAIERKEEAGVLTEQNRSRFHLDNVEIIRGKAPEALAGLKPATHAFIGGSGGNLKEIIDSLYRINPNMRVVMNAVSIETIGEIKEILKLPYVANPDVVLAQFSHGRNVTDYTLMSADNPVWICAFDFKPESE